MKDKILEILNKYSDEHYYCEYSGIFLDKGIFDEVSDEILKIMDNHHNGPPTKDVKNIGPISKAFLDGHMVK